MSCTGRTWILAEMCGIRTDLDAPSISPSPHAHQSYPSITPHAGVMLGRPGTLCKLDIIFFTIAVNLVHAMVDNGARSARSQKSIFFATFRPDLFLYTVVYIPDIKYARKLTVVYIPCIKRATLFIPHARQNPSGL